MARLLRPARRSRPLPRNLTRFCNRARLQSRRRKYQFIEICLGAVIRGETPHFDYVAGQSSRAIGKLALEGKVPVIYGVLTCDSVGSGHGSGRHQERQQGLAGRPVRSGDGRPLQSALAQRPLVSIKRTTPAGSPAGVFLSRMGAAYVTESRSRRRRAARPQGSRSSSSPRYENSQRVDGVVWSRWLHWSLQPSG